jgi:DNA-directed RNA polymerase specialized sigma24 family protein
MKAKIGKRTRMSVYRFAKAALSVGDALYVFLLDLHYVIRGRAPAGSDVQSVLCHVIKSLNPSRRTVLVMMTIQVKAQREVATELQISLQRVRRRWRSALRTVETRLKMEGIDLFAPHQPQPPERKTLAVRTFTRTEAISELRRRVA